MPRRKTTGTPKRHNASAAEKESDEAPTENVGSPAKEQITKTDNSNADANHASALSKNLAATPTRAAHPAGYPYPPEGYPHFAGYGAFPPGTSYPPPPFYGMYPPTPGGFPYSAYPPDMPYPPPLEGPILATPPSKKRKDDDATTPTATTGAASKPLPEEPSVADSSTGDSAREADHTASAERMKTYIKPRTTNPGVADRRSRKNQQSRLRAAKLRQQIAEIEMKPESQRTEEEIRIWAQYETRRRRKNNRSRERALEKKEEIDRILGKPESKRSKIEKQFLDSVLGSKKRKNEGDRLRRKRMKQLGLPTKSNSGVKPGVPARGPIPQGAPPTYPYPPFYGYPYAMPPPPQAAAGAAAPAAGIDSAAAAAQPPMSPLAYNYAPPLFFSPPHGSPTAYASPQRGGPYIPPYYGDSPPRITTTTTGVEQRRNPDGSLNITIGARTKPAKDSK